jgi:hypothetical protein
MLVKALGIPYCSIRLDSDDRQMSPSVGLLGKRLEMNGEDSIEVIQGSILNCMIKTGVTNPLIFIVRL